jgi:hypothetical protein
VAGLVAEHRITQKGDVAAPLANLQNRLYCQRNVIAGRQKSRNHGVEPGQLAIPLQSLKHHGQIFDGHGAASPVRVPEMIGKNDAGERDNIMAEPLQCRHDSPQTDMAGRNIGGKGENAGHEAQTIQKVQVCCLVIRSGGCGQSPRQILLSRIAGLRLLMAALMCSATKLIEETMGTPERPV